MRWPPFFTRGHRFIVFARARRFFAAPFVLGALGMTTPPETLRPGTWGGEQVVFVVGPDKAMLRLGCAEGEVTAPIRLDQDGRFSLSGRFAAHTGGPSTPADTARPARYEGALAGDRLTLTVRHGASTETFHLTLGMQSKVIRCL